MPNAKLGQEIEFTKKHRLVSKNFTKALKILHEPRLRGSRQIASLIGTPYCSGRNKVSGRRPEAEVILRGQD